MTTKRGTYIVIHSTDDQETAKIVSFLALSTNIAKTKYGVTDDLKEYVAEKCPVVVPSCEPVLAIQSAPVEEAFNMDNIGTYIPYRDRMIEPKEEIVEDDGTIDELLMELDAANDEINSEYIESGSPDTVHGNQESDNNVEEYRFLEPKEELVEYDEDVEAAPSAKRSLMELDAANEEINSECIVSATPDTVHGNQESDNNIEKYPFLEPKEELVEYDEDTEDVEEEPSAKRSRISDKHQDVSRIQNLFQSKDTCQKCGKTKLINHIIRLTHSAVHAKVNRLKCSKCNYSSNHQIVVSNHVKNTHPMAKVIEIELSKEEKKKLKKVWKECFPNQDESDTCQVCQRSVSKFVQKRVHASSHVNFMLYKCIENGCKFTAKTSYSITKHQRNAHGEEPNAFGAKIKLSQKQKMKIEEMIKKCFPNIYKYKE